MKKAKTKKLLSVYVIIGLVAYARQASEKPMTARTEDGAYYRWLNKKVLDSRLLDSMEDLSRWSFHGPGEMALTDQRSKDGRHSLRLHSGPVEAVANGAAEWMDLVATRSFPGEDWSAYNRISLWVYADVVGAPAIPLSLILHNDGRHKLPDRTNEGRDESILLQNHSWNHVVWEISSLDRDKITALDVGYSLPKKLPDLGDSTTLDIDQLELQRVDADHVEGWDVANGKIALSQNGYSTGAPKSAIASNLACDEFSVIRQDTGETVLSKKVQKTKAALGDYQVLDFSQIRTPGTYVIHCGQIATRPFRIGDDVWQSSVWKAINFLYSERCGTTIPGIHGICHQDCYSVHGDKRIIVNGGYHDAGDLSATGHTPGIVYSMLSLAQRLKDTGQEPALYRRLIEESKWGLAWVLKTRFGDGYRTTGQLISYWTNGIMGDSDDRFGPAVNDPEWNFRVSGVEALAAHVLKDSDSELAERSLRIAEQDWSFAVEGLKTAPPPAEIYGARDQLERASLGALASVELFIATGEQRYADAAFQLGDILLASQERKLQHWSIPLTGYFYTSPKRENLFHRFHIGEEQAPIVALVRLCETFPDHPDWMKWYSATVLHSEYYLKAAAKIDEPFGMLPAGVYRESDANLLSGGQTWTPLRAADRDTFMQEVQQGFPLGGEYYLRRFPVWFDFRGNFSVLLSQAKALSTAARFRGDLDGIDLAAKQAEWILGRNPFAASTMYGEGYDWAPLYSVRSGEMVGALPVGIETKGVHDTPYWPTQICWTYKEVWTHPVGRWLWLMEDLAGPGVVEGVAESTTREPLVFSNESGGAAVTASVEPSSGTFHLIMPEGRYTVTQGARSTSLTILPNGIYHVDLRREHEMSFKVTSEHAADGALLLRVAAQGLGRHRFAIRTDNLKLDETEETVNLLSGKSAAAVWHARVVSTDTPWVAVVIPDNDLAQRRELTGTMQ